MGALTGERKYYDDAARQVIQMSSRLFDTERGLYDHSWFANTDPDPRFYWGRGAGWALMATAELLSVLPEDHPDRDAVLAIYRRAVKGVASVQSGTGLWHQLLDKTDSYLETSATAMFTFAVARGVNRGWLPPTYAPIAQAGWRALETRVRADGQIEGICVGTTAAYDAVYYYNRPTDLKAMQGYGPVLMAGAEVMAMVRAMEEHRLPWSSVILEGWRIHDASTHRELESLVAGLEEPGAPGAPAIAARPSAAAARENGR